MANHIVKILGIVATAASLVGTALSAWVNEREMDRKIDEKVEKALAERNEAKES